MTTVDPSNHICGGMEMSEIVGSGVFDQCLTQYQRVRRCLWNREVFWSSNILSLFYKVFLKQKKKVELHAFICSFLQFLFLLILPNFTFFTHIDKPLPVGCTPMSRLFHCDWSEGWTDGLKDCKDASVVSYNITREIEDKKWKNTVNRVIHQQYLHVSQKRFSNLKCISVLSSALAMNTFI